MVPQDKIVLIGSVLNDASRPLKERFRALFTLKNIGGDIAVECISKCFKDPSALLKHELAYCLGQMQDENALQILITVLKDTSQEPMVRHEAGEALGAIGCVSVLDILKEYASDPVIEVAETCQLAVKRIQWLQENCIERKATVYDTVDPAPPSTYSDLQTLKTVLLDDTADLFERYRAMFALRNMRSEESTLALAQALTVGSALFRHEVAFVLGQLQDEASVPYLIKCLEDKNQNEMVRHECAEALGAIATDDCFAILQKYLEDDKRVVKESCEIALDMCEYENSPEFQYANTLISVK